MAHDNPIGSDAPRGKDCSERRGRYDPGWTRTEKTMRANLMNQFRRTGEGPGAPSEAFRNSPIWCEACGYYMKADGDVMCQKCRSHAHD